MPESRELGIFDKLINKVSATQLIGTIMVYSIINDLIQIKRVFK